MGQFLAKARLTTIPKVRFFDLTILGPAYISSEVSKLHAINPTAYDHIRHKGEGEITFGGSLILYRFFRGDSYLPPVAELENWLEQRLKRYDKTS